MAAAAVAPGAVALVFVSGSQENNENVFVALDLAPPSAKRIRDLDVRGAFWIQFLLFALFSFLLFIQLLLLYARDDSERLTCEIEGICFRRYVYRWYVVYPF